jgi:hypothetical protein
MHHDQAGFLSVTKGWVGGNNIICHIIKMHKIRKYKNYLIVSMKIEKAGEKT